MKADFVAIVLAAGAGKRMKSPTPKVLHKVLGKPMIERTIKILREVGPSQIITVVSPKNLDLLKQVLDNQTQYAIQKEPLGTADATKAGLKKLGKNAQTVAVLYGDDTAFYRPETILNIYNHHQRLKPKITFATLEKKNPQGLGRVIRKDGKVVAIIEEKDATFSQKQIKEVNDGLYFFQKNWLVQNLSKIKASSKTGEFYLTDLIGLALKNHQGVETYKLPDPSQWHGINTKEELARANQKWIKRIHVMGAAGAGASAICGIAQGYGYQVTGCDLAPQSAYSEKLKGIEIKKNHNLRHLVNTDLLVISPAILKLDPKNQEVAEAKRLKIPVITWQEFQGNFLQVDKFVITIAGAYGKSTTTGMVAQILTDAHLDPTCEIGAKVQSWGSNFRVGKSKHYVCEGDEYNNNFLNYQPDIAVILNVAWDHPDFFKTEESVIVSYKKFVKQIKKDGTLILGDFGGANDLAKLRHDIKVVPIGDYGPYDLSIIGDFRTQNANAALTVAELLGVDLKRAKRTVENFGGIGRRLEYKGKVDGVKFYDDYAVQPYTIEKTANALKEKFKNQKVALVLEPHTFSRIETFFSDFVKSLKETKVDRVFITNVYAAREKGDTQKLSRSLAKSIGPKAIYTGSLEKTAAYLKGNLNQFDVICSMGAGDIYKLYDLLK